jgi:hypothetical protein
MKQDKERESFRTSRIPGENNRRCKCQDFTNTNHMSQVFYRRLVSLKAKRLQYVWLEVVRNNMRYDIRKLSTSRNKAYEVNSCE